MTDLGLSLTLPLFKQVIKWLQYVHIRKKRESVPVARSAHQGSRIAHLAKTSNAEAHADMYIHPVCSHAQTHGYNKG